MDRASIFDISYALTALGGREKALYGPYFPLARQAFDRSLAGEAYPEVWYEFPLMGEPWLDVHVGTWRDALSPDDVIVDPENRHVELYEWLAREGEGARQLVLSYDTSSGSAENPATQLLLAGKFFKPACAFLEKVGRADAIAPYQAFIRRMPDDWFACYIGVFSGRPEKTLRVECIPTSSLTKAYARDASLLKEHLESVGVDTSGDTIVPRCQLLAGLPFEYEYQFDITEEGLAAPTFGVSLRFACPPGDDEKQAFFADGTAGKLMELVESWGLADDRWRQIEHTTFAKSIANGDEKNKAYCYPLFVKLRWRDGEPLDAKFYLDLSTAEETA